MQDAYAVEALDVGGWNAIGYTGPGSNSTGASESNVFKYSELTTGWKAVPKNKLNDCQTNTTKGWQLYAHNSSNTAEGQGNVSYSEDNDTNCEALTPSLEKLIEGRSST